MRNLFQPVSYQKGAWWAVCSTTAWKACSFLNSILLALYFGTRPDTDLYFYLIMISGMAVNFAQRVNAAVFIPEAMNAEKTAPQSGMRLLNTVFCFYIFLGGLVAAAGLLFPTALARALTRFSPALLAGQTHLFSAVCLLFACQLITSYLSGLLEMRKLFGSAWLAPANALFPLACLLMGAKQWGIISMVYGFLAANVLQMGVFIYLLKTRCGWDFTPGRGLFHTRLKKNLLTSQLLELVGLANTLIPVYLISGLAGGLVSALNYAKQLADAPTEILTWRITGVSKIQLSEDSARQDGEALNVHFLRTNRFLFFLLMPLFVFTAFYALDIVRLFFERGNFTAQSAREAAAFLRPLLLVMVLLAPVMMQNNLFAAQRKLKEALPYLLVSNLLFTGAVIAGIYYWGAFAYPYLQAACCLIGFAINKYLFAKHFAKIAYGRSLLDGVRILSLNIIALVPAAAATKFCAFSAPFFTVFTGGIIFLAALWALTKYSGDWRVFLHTLAAR